jgi:hypothetical protein
MNQGYINYRRDGYEPEDNWGPPGKADIYIDKHELSSVVRKLLAYLRASQLKSEQLERYPKKSLIPIVSPTGFSDMLRLKKHPSYLKEFPTALQEKQNALLHKVSQTLSQHWRELRAVLREIDSEEAKIRYLYERAEVIVPVDESETGAFLYAIHFPERKLSIDILRSSLELWISHAEKQQKPSHLCAYLKAGAEMADIYSDLPIFTSPYPSKITTDIDTPDEEMNAFLEGDGLEESI